MTECNSFTEAPSFVNAVENARGKGISGTIHPDDGLGRDGDRGFADFLAIPCKRAPPLISPFLASAMMKSVGR